MADRLTDIEVDSLAVTIRSGLAEIAAWEHAYHPDQWPRELKRHRQIGLYAIETGSIMEQARRLRISLPNAMGIAALAMMPGGVRVARIVFCAAHYPDGMVASWRYACPVCDPDALTLDGRDTITITYEGEAL